MRRYMLHSVTGSAALFLTCSRAYGMLVGHGRNARLDSHRRETTGVLTVQRAAFCTASVPRLSRRIRNSRRIRHREPAPGDWSCQCGEVNARVRRECVKCGAPAPPLPPGVRRPAMPGEDPLDWACPCGQMNFRGSVLCHKCQQPKPEPPPLPGKEVTLWTCPHCKGVNRSTRKYCFKCSAPSPLMDFRPPQSL